MSQNYKDNCMFRGKALVVALVSTISFEALAATAKVPVVPARPITRARAPKETTQFSVGLGYMIFSETLKATDSAQIDHGFANYAGVLATIAHAWIDDRMIYEATGGIASGKATAGGFASISYPDSGRRAWTLAYLEGSARYRLNARINLGIGLLAGYRSADWKSEANPAVKVTGLNKSIYAPEFIMQWLVSRHFSLMQTISTPDFRGSSMWRWSSQFNF